MKKNITSVFAAILIYFLYAIPANSTPPSTLSWKRGTDGATWQEWHFTNSTEPKKIIADDSFNPYGTPSVDIRLYGPSKGYDAGWYESYLGRKGVWHSHFTEVILTIPGGKMKAGYKEVWVEIGVHGELIPHPRYPDLPEKHYGPKLTASIDGTPLPSDQVIEIDRIAETLDRVPGIKAKPWKKVTLGWRIKQNSDSENIYLAFHNSGADIDYISVDTKIFNSSASK